MTQVASDNKYGCIYYPYLWINIDVLFTHESHATTSMHYFKRYKPSDIITSKFQ